MPKTRRVSNEHLNKDLTMLTNVITTMKQFENKLDKLSSNIQWQASTLMELRALVTESHGTAPRGSVVAGTNTKTSKVSSSSTRATIGTQCGLLRAPLRRPAEPHTRRRQAVKPIGHPLLSPAAKLGSDPVKAKKRQHRVPTASPTPEELLLLHQPPAVFNLTTKKRHHSGKHKRKEHIKV